MILPKFYVFVTVCTLSIFGSLTKASAQTIEELFDLHHVSKWPQMHNQIVHGKIGAKEASRRCISLTNDELLAKSEVEFLEWTRSSPDLDVFKIFGKTEKLRVRAPELSNIPNLKAVTISQSVEKMDIEILKSELGNSEDLAYIGLGVPIVDSMQTAAILDACVESVPALYLTNYKGPWPARWDCQMLSFRRTLKSLTCQ